MRGSIFKRCTCPPRTDAGGRRLTCGKVYGSWSYKVDLPEDAAAGEPLLEGRTGETATADGMRLWAGRARDPFYFDLALLEPIIAAVTGGTAPDLSQWDPAKAENTFGETTVASIVLEVPHGFAGLTPGARVAVWAATKLSDGNGGFRQVNRGGLPMMWPIFWPTDTDFSNPANRRHPSQDVAADRHAFAQMLTASAQASDTVDDPDAFGQVAADQLLPDVLPYEVGTPARFDVRRVGAAAATEGRDGRQQRQQQVPGRARAAARVPALERRPDVHGRAQ